MLGQLAAQDPAGLAVAVRSQRVLALGQLLEQPEGQWLAELAEVDAVGLAGRKRGSRWARPPAGCAAGWQERRGRPPRGPDRPSPVPRPLPATGQALTNGELSVAQAQVLAHRTRALPSR